MLKKKRLHVASQYVKTGSIEVANLWIQIPGAVMPGVPQAVYVTMAPSMPYRQDSADPTRWMQKDGWNDLSDTTLLHVIKIINSLE